MIRLEEKERAVKLYRLYGLGREEDGEIVFHPIEILFSLEEKLIPEDQKLFEKVELSKKEDALFEIKQKIFRFLWKRGYISKFIDDAPEYMRVYRKGFRPGEDRTHYLLKIVNKKNITIEEIINDLNKAGEMRKELIYALMQKNNLKFWKISNMPFL